MLPYNIFYQFREEPVYIMLFEEFSDNRTDLASRQDHTMYYWMSTRWPKNGKPAGWGQRLKLPVHANVPGGFEDKMCGMGVDWDPEHEVFGCVTAYYNTTDGQDYQFFHRSYDYGQTWDAGIDITGAPGGIGGPSGFWYNNGFGDVQAYPIADCIKYCGDNMWIIMGSNEIINLVSDNGGDSWIRYVGSNFLPGNGPFNINNDTFEYALHSNWMCLEGGPWHRFIGAPPRTHATVVAGGDAPAIAHGRGGLAGGCWNVFADWYTDYGTYFLGCPPYKASGEETVLIGGNSRGSTYVPGNLSGVWLYCGDNDFFGNIPIFGRVPGDLITADSAESGGSSHWLISEAYQQNIYEGWEGLGAPPPRVQEGCRLRTSPHPSLNGTFRAWHFQGQIGLVTCMTLCYSDNQGITWNKKSDYILGPGVSLGDWRAAGQHPIFWPGNITIPATPEWLFLGDLVWHPFNPKNIITTGHIQNKTPNKWSTIMSYDGGELWENYESFPAFGSGGPDEAHNMIVAYKWNTVSISIEKNEATASASVRIVLPIHSQITKAASIRITTGEELVGDGSVAGSPISDTPIGG